MPSASMYAHSAKPGGKSFEELWRERAAANPARRFGRPEELGAYCAFLCSEHAGFITGQNLLIEAEAIPEHIEKSKGIHASDRDRGACERADIYPPS